MPRYRRKRGRHRLVVRQLPGYRDASATLDHHSFWETGLGGRTYRTFHSDGNLFRVNGNTSWRLSLSVYATAGCHGKRTANDLTLHQRRHLAVTYNTFEPVVLRIARQTNVQNHFRRALRTLNPHGVLRNAIRFRFCSRHQISQETGLLYWMT